ncbi:hypothetical protein Bca4012_019222 [Brassica carinata]|uniref:Uncharacterized protein n=1 Tax=Brassica carinata TaxID=52824 RepID=A0A8X7WKJ3_BRACI|nr:hypothetical protein Bca52824_002371 [Brassica carinata]
MAMDLSVVEMQYNGLVPDAILYNSLLKGTLKARKVTGAYQLLHLQLCREEILYGAVELVDEIKVKLEVSQLIWLQLVRSWSDFTNKRKDDETRSERKLGASYSEIERLS